jgi:hypothetical protein
MAKRPIVALLALVSIFVLRSAEAAEIAVEKTEQGATVKIDGKPFTEFVAKSGTKPILWPIIGPTGKAMTRSWPMNADAPKSEKRDHPHHRSFWMTHGLVNGVDFWSEGSKAGTIVNRKLSIADAGDSSSPAITATNDWQTRDGKKVCEEEQTIRFGADDARRWIDFTAVLKATEGPLTFGDTKEGAFGVRVAETMKVEAKLGGKIVNSEGQTDGEAWGKPAKWVDYHGPVEDETLGIAILDHPKNLRHPTPWHVRTYGLFAANPFGLHDFAGGDKNVDGKHTVEKGGAITLRYRVLLHKGDEKEGRVAEAFEEWTK